MTLPANLLRPLKRCIYPSARKQLLPCSDLRDALVLNDGKKSGVQLVRKQLVHRFSRNERKCEIDTCNEDR